MTEQQDTDLRARFDAQRRVHASDAPAFAGMLARARAEADAPAMLPRRFKLRRLVYAGSLAAAAAIAALLVMPRSTSKDEFERAVHAFQNDPALGGWKSPTAGLLDVPGSQLISTVPSVGTP